MARYASTSIPHTLGNINDGYIGNLNIHKHTESVKELGMAWQVLAYTDTVILSI